MELGVFEEFAAKLRSAHRRAKRKNRPRHTNTMLWRGIVAEGLPSQNWRMVRVSGKLAWIADAADTFLWQGQRVPAGARLLTKSDPERGVVGCDGEVVQHDSPCGPRVRVHIWRSPAIYVAPAQVSQDTEYQPFDADELVRLMAEGDEELPTMSTLAPARPSWCQ